MRHFVLFLMLCVKTTGESVPVAAMMEMTAG